MVWQLKKSVYSLKQKPLLWNSSQNKILVKHRYIWCLVDPCLYKKFDYGSLCRLAVCVDDIVLVCDNLHLLEKESTAFCKDYKMSLMVKLLFLLGLEVKVENERLSISQQLYAS
jgi:Reverse transcriptase (RNA-dependent DNA polymerase)